MAPTPPGGGDIPTHAGHALAELDNSIALGALP